MMGSDSSGLKSSLRPANMSITCLSGLVLKKELNCFKILIKLMVNSSFKFNCYNCFSHDRN